MVGEWGRGASAGARCGRRVSTWISVPGRGLACVCVIRVFVYGLSRGILGWGELEGVGVRVYLHNGGRGFTSVYVNGGGLSWRGVGACL